jgi:hypothetical protein
MTLPILPVPLEPPTAAATPLVHRVSSRQADGTELEIEVHYSPVEL